MAGKKFNHLIVDTAALIKNVKIEELGENIYTLPEVIEEIKDKATRERLSFLPYKLNFRQPSSEIVQIVSEFSKKTGDYRSLSATDIRLVALTYQLEKEFVGTEHLRSEPLGKAELVVDCQNVNVINISAKLINALEFCTVQSAFQIVEKSIGSEKNTPVIGFYQPENDSIDSDEVKNEEEFSDSEDDEGWITNCNLVDAKKQMLGLKLEDSQVEVACITTDFAMQNVLLQIGLHPVSIDGMLIRETKTYIFRCHACFRTTTIMTKEFCPHCGNKTLKRVAVTVNEDGTKSMHINFKRPINIRGMRYSLPMPKGGRHAVNPILCEDQQVPQNRPSKLDLQKSKLTDDDYEYMGSPFAINDVYSRAGHLGIRSKVQGHSRKNPNEKSRRTGNRKRS